MQNYTLLLSKMITKTLKRSEINRWYKTDSDSSTRDEKMYQNLASKGNVKCTYF